MSFHYDMLADLDAALQSGKIETKYHYVAKRALRAAQMSGSPIKTLEELAERIKEIGENGGMTARQIYNPRYC